MPKREIAIVDYRNGYAGLVDAFRARAQERKIAITSSNVAAMANLPDFYVAKLLPFILFAALALISLGPLLGVLGMKLIAVPDEDAIARYSGKLPPRNEGCAHDNAVIRFAFSRRHMQKLGQTGAKVRWEAARKRRRAAQRAAQAQWAGMTAEERSAWARKLYHARAKAREGNGKANG